MTVGFLRHHDFARAWLAQLISVVGDGLYYVAMIWWVKVTTGSNAAVATVALCAAIPAVALGPVAGAYADRLDRRRLMLTMDSARGILLLAPALLLATHHLAVWHLCLVAALVAACSAFFGPAFGAAIPLLVPAEDVAAANALSQTSFAAGALLGPALGGALVAIVGTAPAILIDAATFGVSAALLGVSRIPSPPRAAAAARSLGRDMLDGFVFFRRRPLLLGMVGQVVIINFFRAPLGVLLPSLARDVFGTGAAGFGLLEGMMPAGFLLGGLALSLRRVQGVGRALIWLLVAWGLAIGCIGVSRALPVTAALLVIAGVALVMVNILGSGVFQTRIPTEMQGRTFGAFNALSQGLQPVALALTAPVVGLVGLQPLFLVGGLTMAACGLAGYLIPGLAHLQRMGDPIPEHYKAVADPPTNRGR